jgi:DNA-binding MarR family transcriptional regulator
MPLSQAETNRLLFESLRAVYRFEQDKVAEFRLDYGAIYLLQYLRRRSRATMSQVAAEMCVPISTASRLADRLQKRGLISRARDAADRRRVLVSLRSRGRELVRKVERHSFARLTTNLQGVPAQSVAALVLAARLLPDVLEVTGEESSR